MRTTCGFRGGKGRVPILKRTAVRSHKHQRSLHWQGRHIPYTSISHAWQSQAHARGRTCIRTSHPGRDVMPPRCLSYCCCCGVVCPRRTCPRAQGSGATQAVSRSRVKCVAPSSCMRAGTGTWGVGYMEGEAIVSAQLVHERGDRNRTVTYTRTRKRKSYMGLGTGTLEWNDHSGYC